VTLVRGERTNDLDRRIGGTALAILAVACLAVRLAFVARLPGSTGYDAYYYAVQIRALIERGTLAYRGASLVYGPMALLGAVFGPERAAAVSAAVGGALLPLAVYGAARELSRSAWVGLAAAALAARSEVHFVASIELIKNAWALAAYAAFVGACARADREPGPRRVAAAAIWGVAAVGSHASTAPLVAILGAAIAAPHLARSWRTTARVRAALLAGTLAGITAFALWGPAAGSRLLRANLSLTPHLCLPDFATRLEAINGPVYALELLVYPVILGAALAALAIPASRRALVSSPVAVGLTITLAVLLAPVWTCNPMGLFSRLIRMALVPALLLAAAAAGYARLSVRRVASAAVYSGALLTLPLQLRLPYARSHPHFEAGRDAIAAVARLVPRDALVLAPHGWQFFVTYVTRLDAASARPRRTGRPVWILRIRSPMLPPGGAAPRCASSRDIPLAPGFSLGECR